MSAKKNDTKGDWIDPDDAPEWSDEMFDRAQITIDGKIARRASLDPQREHLRRRARAGPTAPRPAGGLVAVQHAGGAAAAALDPQPRPEPDEIGDGADVLGGHGSRLGA